MKKYQLGEIIKIVIKIQYNRYFTFQIEFFEYLNNLIITFSF